MAVPVISIVIGTFGDPSWERIADRAAASAEAQTVQAEVIRSRGDSLHEARNAGAAKASGEYLIFLDADDELDSRYVEAMAAAIDASPGSLYQPATLGVVSGVEDPEPVLIPSRPLSTGNFMVIGTAVSRDLFHRVGGFLDWPIYEDWCLWIRCYLAGARPVKVPDAIYRVHVSPTSRNNQPANVQAHYFNEIRKRYYR